MLGIVVVLCSLLPYDSNVETISEFKFTDNFEHLGEFKLTAYEKRESKSGKTYTGMVANYKKNIVAVDRRRIPMGSILYIDGLGLYTAEDIGGAIKGKKLDVLVRDGTAKKFGRQRRQVWIVRRGRTWENQTMIPQMASILNEHMRK